MDAKTKADFILALHKHSLRAFDTGGGLSGDISGGVQTAMSPVSGVLGGVSHALTTENGYQASGPDMAGVVAQQGQLGNLLMGEAAGSGPNPAQLEYLQNAQDISNQQAMLNAKNRALNPGLAARMSSNAAVTAQSGAARNAEIGRMKQQLAAQHEMAGLTGQEMSGSEHAMDINSQVAQNNANAVNQTEGGLLSGIGGMLGVGGLFAEGGRVMSPAKMTHFHRMVVAKRMAAGGSSGGIGKNRAGGSISMTDGSPGFSNASFLASTSQDKGSSGGSGSGLGQFLNGGSMGIPDASSIPDLVTPELGSSAGLGAAPAAPSLGVAALALSDGGGVPRLTYSAPQALTNGGQAMAKSKGQKASMPGDSLKNDKIPALLSEGEEVIDRDTMQDPGPIGQMARTVAAAINHKKSKADFVRISQAKRKAGAA